MASLKGNCIVAQSGGPTAVINASACGVIETARKHKDKVVDVRGLGLMQGVEFKGDASAVVKGLRDKGILTIKAGEKVLRLLPPLVIKPAEIREFLAALETVVGELPAA